MKINLLVEGGEMKPGPTLAQKLGPLGINIGQVISDVNKETLSFKGIKVPVELDVDTKTKKVKIKVSAPPVAELIKKELILEKGSGDHKNEKVGNIAIEQIISIAKTKMPGMLDKTLKKAVKSIVGTCSSLGILVENKLAKEIEKEIDSGKYDHEINSAKTELSKEKKEKLAEFFLRIKEVQEKKKAEVAAAAAAEEAAKTAAAAAGVAAPVAGAAAGKEEAEKKTVKTVETKETKPEKTKEKK